MAEIEVKSITGNKEFFAGIKTDMVNLSLESDKKGNEIVFEFPKKATVVATGIGVDASEKGELEFSYKWNVNEAYKLLLSVATDSVANVSIYTGYAWLPKEKKWKLIGTCKITGHWNTIQTPATYFTKSKKENNYVSIGTVWCQRKNGAWFNLKNDSAPNPAIKLSEHVDSTKQKKAEIKLMEEAIATGKTDKKKNKENVYYTILKEGTGKQVIITDTVSVFYKGYLFQDGEVFD